MFGKTEAAAEDAYTHCYTVIVREVLRVVRCVDKTFLWVDDIESAFWHTFDKYLTLYMNNGIAFNPDKFVFVETSAVFLLKGLTLTATSIKPCANMLLAIQDFPAPRDITGARSDSAWWNKLLWHTASNLL